MVAALGAGTGWLLLAALVLALGSVAGRWVVLPRSRPPGDALPGLGRGAARLGFAGAILLLLSLLLVFVRQLVEFRDPFASWTGEARLLVAGTDWGTAWTLALAGAGLAGAGFFAALRDRAVGWWTATPAILAVAAFPAFTGHAAAAGGLRPLTLAADTLHVWSAGAWMGGLTFVLALEWRWRRTAAPGTGEELLPGLVAAFSPLAVACVVTLIGTGVFAAWVQLPSLRATYDTSYGRLLILKLTLALVAFGLGALNWRRLTPLLRDPQGPTSLRRAASVELLVMHTVLLVTAVLVRTSATGH